MMRRFAYAGTLIGTLFAVAAILIPGQVQAQELPVYSCPTDVLQRTCTRENDADPERNIPASTTRCEFEGLETRRTTCVTTFEDGMEQSCEKVGQPLGDNLFQCTNTRPGGGSDTSNQESVTGQVVGAVTGAVADTANTLVVKPIVMFVLTFAGWILGVVGVFFNWVVIKTVFQFGTYFGTTDSMLAAWGVMRDVANIGILFGFIFMGVLLILNVDGGGHGHGHGGGISARKAIPRLIIFAVLLNFSLFASQIVIDVANAFASSFTVLAGEQCTADADTTACANQGIAGQVLQMAGIGTVWDEGIISAFKTSTVTLLGLTLFVTITAVVLLAAALMLVFRVVVLTLLMVTSPIGFAGMVIPGLQGLASKWWHSLISQAFFAPVLLLLIFISLKLAESLNPNGTPIVKAFSEANTSLAANLEVLVVFAVVIGLMIGSLVAASKIGAMGASFATNAASAVVFGTVTRGTNFAAGGVGRLGRYAVQNAPGNKEAAWRSGVTNLALRPLEKANLDLRRLPGTSTALGAAGISAGAKAADHATYGDIVHQYDDIRSGKAREKRTEQYKDELKNQSLERNAHSGTMTDEDKAHLASLSTKELEQLHGIKTGVQQMAEALSSEQFENLMKSDKLGDDEKGALKGARFKTLADAAASGGPVKDLLKNMSKKDLENLPPAILMQAAVLENLSDTQRDDLKKSDKRTPAERAAIKAAAANEVLKAVFASAGGTAAGPAAAAAVRGHARFGSMSAAQFADLGIDILSQQDIAKDIPVSVLEKIVKDNKLNPAEMKRVGAQMEAAIAAGTASPGVAGYMASPKGDFWR